MRRAMVLVTCANLVLATISGPASGANVLFDVAHGQHFSWTTSQDFETARALLTGAGHTLTELTSPITPAALSGYDMYVSGTLDFDYDAAEIVALQDWVAEGGTVLVVHDGGYDSDPATPSVNQFLTPYGMALSLFATYGEGVVVSGFVPHCLTDGVQTVGMDYVRQLALIVTPAQDLTTGNTEVLAVYEGVGMVIVCGDDSGFTDADSPSDYHITDFDNQQLLLNLFSCGNHPVPTARLSWGAVKALYR